MRQILALVLAVFVALSCSNDDGVGSYSISGTPELISVEAGYKRVVATWSVNTTSDEASVSNIYWSEGSNSTGQYLSSDSGNTITIDISDVSEGEHTFYVQNATPTSNRYSAPSNSLTVYVYGDSYCKALATRLITSIMPLEEAENGESVVTWDDASSVKSGGGIGSELYYTDRAGELTSKFCSIDDSQTTLSDAMVDSEVSTSSLYIPDGCIDTLASIAVVNEDLIPESEDGIIRVASIVAMQPYFAMDDVHIILETGEYRVTAQDIKDGLYPNYAEVAVDDITHSLFLAKGDNSIYDFGGSTVTVETSAFDASGYEFFPIHFLGNNNVIKNLTQVDEGAAEAIHPNGINNCVMDGADNTLQGVTIRSTGSSPYGYGELFGKGGPWTIYPHKHCALLMRGDNNTVKACSLYHRAYGHCLYMQGGTNMTIEDTYVEGDMRCTNEILDEKGTGSAADLIDFETQWGYTVPADYTLSLVEDGIRTYNTGNTMINGVRYAERSTETVTVRNCYVKNARGGIALTLGGGDRYVENTTSVGCDRGFSVGTEGKIVNCFADCQYGPAYGVDYIYNRDIEVEITILPNQSPTQINGYEAYNKSGQMARIIGYRNKIVFHADPTLESSGQVQNMFIEFGGDDRAVSELYDTLDEEDSWLNMLINETQYPILLSGDNSSGEYMSWNNWVVTEGLIFGDGNDANIQKLIKEGVEESDYDLLDEDLTIYSNSKP